MKLYQQCKEKGNIYIDMDNKLRPLTIIHTYNKHGHIHVYLIYITY